eukprot:6179842-Pleurochrysis_carterae.AAC.1
MSCRVLRIELRLSESFDLHKIFFCRPMPDSARVGLAVPGLQKLSFYWDSSILEESLVGWRSNVGGLDVDFPLSKVGDAAHCAK